MDDKVYRVSNAENARDALDIRLVQQRFTPYVENIIAADRRAIESASETHRVLMERATDRITEQIMSAKREIIAKSKGVTPARFEALKDSNARMRESYSDAVKQIKALKAKIAKMEAAEQQEERLLRERVLRKSPAPEKTANVVETASDAIQPSNDTDDLYELLKLYQYK